MAAVTQNPAFGAIENHLKTLCLREFPCGPGGWREPEPVDVLKKKKTLRRGQLKSIKKETIKTDSTDLEVIKAQAQRENSWALQELVNSKYSPWHLDYSWSEEAKELREIAVKSPWLIDNNFVFNYFKTLRIVDKNVTEVDQNLLKLKNLEELTLSANYVTSVNSKNLPRSLRVLELCANNISDISALCVRPPLLQHLGLGHNRISFIGDYLTGDYWPNLLSLDLSHNDLCDLLDVIRKMGTLPRLRNLILQGNPLSLIPGYRGYTIDSLRRLSVMDDIHVSADEKHHFKGLARRREFILDEARVQLGIPYIKGLPCPEEIKNPDGQPEFPVVERKYFVQFMFPEERSGNAAEGTIENADMADFAALDTEAGTTDRTNLLESEEQTERRPDSAKMSDAKLPEPQIQGAMDKNVLFDSQPQMKSAEAVSNPGSAASFPRPAPNTDPHLDPAEDGERSNPEVEGINLDLLDDQEGEDGKTKRSEKSDEPTPRFKLVPINSEPQPWAEELELNWTLDLTRDDLLALREFFKQGMDFTVVEQVVLGYPAEPETGSEKNAETKDSKKKLSAKGAKSKEKEKAKSKPKPLEPPKIVKKDKGGKKKKEPEVELVRSPPTYTTIAAFHITLDTFLDGEFEYRNIFTKGDVPPPSTIRSMDGEDKKVDKKDSKEKKKAQDKSPDKKKDAKKSPRGKDGDKKGGKGKHAEEAEDEDLPPPPLELEVTVKLHHWTTAMDSVREEEEKNRQLQQAVAGESVKDKIGSKESVKH